MKNLPIAAAVLLFGSSAYALAAAEPTVVMVDKDAYTVTKASALGSDAGAYKWQPATADWWEKGEPVAYVADDAALKSADMTGEAKLKLASSDDFAASDAEWDAIAAEKDAAAAAGEPAFDSAIVEPDPVMTETSVLDEEPVPVGNGVGGPYEPAQVAAADLTPSPAAGNYPACRPGRGDDRCIQLYEPGVREQLASWTQPTGGFAGESDTQVAMGGPYEPVADSATETERLNQQALADSNAALQSIQMANAAADAPTYDDAAVETAMADDADMVGADDMAVDDEDVGEV